MTELVFFIRRKQGKIFRQTDKLGTPSLRFLAKRFDLGKIALNISSRAKLNHCGF